MGQMIKLFFVSFVTIIIFDYVWLGLVAKKFYIDNLTAIGRIHSGQFQPVLWAAGVVYLFLAVTILFFVLPRLESSASLLTTFFTGAFIGVLVYGVYDMTNYSTLKDFPLHLAFADMAWGGVVCGLATLATKFVRDL